MLEWERVVDKNSLCCYYVPSEFIDIGGIQDVAVFDWSGTLIRSAKGTQLVTGVDNWIWTADSVPGYLNELNRKGWIVVVISNQSAAKEETIEPVLKRFEKMASGLDFIPSVFISMSMRSVFAKPQKTMWDMFLHVTQITPSPASFSVGDNSRGLTDDPQFNQGDTDVLFARNIGLTPYVPTEIFPVQPDYVPSGKLELIVLMGVPGSGKSTFARSLMEKYGYMITGRENKKYVKTVTDALKIGQSIVFDATNPTREKRGELIDLGHQHGARVVIAWATRPGRPYNDLRTGKEKVPAIVYNMYSTHFEIPIAREGAEQIFRIN